MNLAELTSRLMQQSGSNAARLRDLALRLPMSETRRVIGEVRKIAGGVDSTQLVARLLTRAARIVGVELSEADARGMATILLVILEPEK